MIESNVENPIGVDKSPRAKPALLASKHESPYSLVLEGPSPKKIPKVSSPTTPSHTNA